MEWFSSTTIALLAEGKPMIDVNEIVQVLIYSLIGIALFGLAYFCIVQLSPFSIRKEIEEDQNTSLGIIIGAVIIGLAMIVSSAVQG